MLETVRLKTAYKNRPLRFSLHRTAVQEKRRVEQQFRSAVPFLGASLLLGTLAVGSLFYTPAYQVTIEGEAVGLVQERTWMQESVQAVESNLSQVLGTDFTYTGEIDYGFTIGAKKELLTYSELEQQIYETIPQVKESFLLAVDGQQIGAFADKQSLDSVLDTLKTPYLQEENTSTTFVNAVDIQRNYIPAEQTWTDSALALASLQEAVPQVMEYTTKMGDSLAVVLEKFGMEEARFYALNPDFVEGMSLHMGQAVTVEQMLPRLSVESVQETAYMQALTSPIRTIEDPDLYAGDSQVIVQGHDGRAWVESKVYALNGTTYREEILSQKVMIDATETVVAEGTMERPATVGLGQFQWPTEGNFSSPFGYRTLFNSFHNGIDISNAYGTPILAADAGTVTCAEYKGSFGNLIIIDHGNGMETYYAHNSTMDVSVGQVVKQGDYIAGMGATGRATGKHCHFEIRINGEPVDPMLYLPAR